MCHLVYVLALNTCSTRKDRETVRNALSGRFTEIKLIPTDFLVANHKPLKHTKWWRDDLSGAEGLGYRAMARGGDGWGELAGSIQTARSVTGEDRTSTSLLSTL